MRRNPVTAFIDLDMGTLYMVLSPDPEATYDMIEIDSYRTLHLNSDDEVIAIEVSDYEFFDISDIAEEYEFDDLTPYIRRAFDDALEDAGLV